MRPHADTCGTVRFWSKVDRSGGLDACWPWTKGLGRKGYGQFHDQRKNNRNYPVRAHRVALQFASGPAPPDKPFALHSCHAPSCCNPRHLRWGTHLENMEDMREQGSGAGENNSFSKLTWADVRVIRSTPNPNRSALARKFGVSSRTVGYVLLGKTWLEKP